MIKRVINTTNTGEADAVFVSAPYEKTASSHKGTAAGPSAVIEQLDTQIEFFNRKLGASVIDFVKTAHQDLGDVNHLSPEENKEKIKSTISPLVQAGKFVFLLGGEHAVSVGHLEALAEKYTAKDITIMQLDAHCDLRNDDSDYSDTPSSLAHSTVMRRASEMGFPIVQVGIRTYSEDEHAYFSNPENNVTVHEWGNGKPVPSKKQILETIKTKYLYISIDVDGFDPAHMPGTGTAVQGGLEWWYGLDLIEEAIDNYELVGADIVEVSPLEGSVLTEYGAAELAYRMLAHKFRDRLVK